MGVRTMSLSEKTGDIVDAKIVSKEDRLLIMTREGITINLRVDDIRSSSRNTQGVKAINLSDDDRVASVERMFDSKLPAEEVVPIMGKKKARRKCAGPFAFAPQNSPLDMG